MSSGCRNVLLAFALLAGGASSADARELRVCADPNNLPFSNERLEGFENDIVGLIAHELDAELRYTWRAQRRGFIRNTLGSKVCDLTAGTVAGLPSLKATKPYYRSTYVFVSRPSLAEISSLDDPALRRLRIGIHLIGDDGFNVPPAHALARRGIVENVRGYSLYGDYREQNPPARLIEAVASGEIDIAIAWGPLGGYFAARQSPPLRVTAVLPALDGQLPMTFAISMAVHRDDEALRTVIEAILTRRQPDIDTILARYNVPRAEPPRTAAGPPQ
jgi:mxaJ protein